MQEASLWDGIPAAPAATRSPPNVIDEGAGRTVPLMLYEPLMVALTGQTVPGEGIGGLQTPDDPVHVDVEEASQAGIMFQDGFPLVTRMFDDQGLVAGVSDRFEPTARSMIRSPD